MEHLTGFCRGCEGSFLPPTLAPFFSNSCCACQDAHTTQDCQTCSGTGLSTDNWMCCFEIIIPLSLPSTLIFHLLFHFLTKKEQNSLFSYWMRTSFPGVGVSYDAWRFKERSRGCRPLALPTSKIPSEGEAAQLRAAGRQGCTSPLIGRDIWDSTTSQSEHLFSWSLRQRRSYE